MHMGYRMIGSAPTESNMEKCALQKQTADEEEWNDSLNTREKWSNGYFEA